MFPLIQSDIPTP